MKISKQHAIEVCLNTLKKALLDTDNQRKLLVNVDVIRKALNARLMFKVPIYDDYQSFASEVVKDVRDFLSSAENLNFSYSIQECKIFGDEIVLLLEKFFRKWKINSFLKEFSLLTTLLSVSLPGLIISIVNLFIK